MNLIKFTSVQLLVYLLIIPFISFGQSEFITINGFVSDNKNIPLPFVSVYVKNTHFGSVANEDGRFSIKIPATANQLTVSSMGYKTITHTISNTTKEQRIVLQNKSLELSEVVISSFTPESLLKKAVEMIPQNYPVKPVVLHTFLREKLFVNDTLEYFAEAAYSIEKSYKKSFTDKNYIDKNRTFRFFKDTSITITLLGGEVSDFVKNREHNYGEILLKNHKLSFGTSTIIDERTVYVVHITPKNNFKKTAIDGYLYIDMQTYAFLKIDVKYIHKNPDKYTSNRQSYSAHYRYVGDKCYPVYFSVVVEKFFKKNGIDKKANAYLTSIVTSIDTVVDEKNKNKMLFQDGNSLEYYPTNYDTTYWSNYTCILPDKETEQALIRYHDNKKDSINLLSLKPEANKPKTIPELYHPHISIFLSSQLPNNLIAFNETYMSINSLINYYALKSKKVFKYGGFISPLFSFYISIPFQSVEAERELLSKNKMKATYNPTAFNYLLSSYCYGVSNLEICNLKNSNYADFMRLHTVRKDANYMSIKSIEEKIVLADFKNKKVKSDYFKSYYFELFTRRFAYSIYYFPNTDFYSDDNSISENKKAVIIDNSKSFVKYLYNPTDSFQRYVSKNDLTNQESRYLTRVAYFSFLNLISPQAIGIKPFKLFNDIRFTFSLSYLLIPFGEMFEQNFWIYSKFNTVGLFFRQYKNYNSLGAGLGLKLYNYKITEKLNCQTTIDYWYQPEKQLFYDNHFVHGFGVNQTFEYKIREDTYNHNGDISLYIGYDYKTKGYQPQNLNMKNDFSFFCGLKYNFYKY